MSSSGKGGNNRKNRQRFKQDKKKHNENLFSENKFEKNRITMQERLRWTAPVLPNNPITTPNCPWCGKQIDDIVAAITDKETGLPVHFDCVIARIANMEQLENNDCVCYIGGGRFGIIHYNNPPDTKDFTIKKIFEWEMKDTNTEWRRPISEYFSIT
jgi:hypothetical protein